ncbi:tyrosine-type recombinase/integrase [Nonomuraea dietziae]|uniref:tyrosine-type recombinase/integrase n=1 Tax=Nonomuraea dietziae TaxID=65515 RepID=UPI003421E1D6
MASIEPPRKSAKGHLTYRVTWVTGGRRGGARDSETCDSKAIAKRFKALVEAAGERRPEGYPKGCRGVAPAAAEPEAQLPAEIPSFGQVLEHYLAQPNHRAEPRQLTNYRRLFDRHVRGAVVTVPAGLDGAERRVGPLGGLPITEVTTDVIQAWVTWMEQRRRPVRGQLVPYASKTIINIHGGVIAPTLAYATRSGLLEANPSAWVRLPSQQGRTVTLDNVPTGHEIPEWIACAYAVDQLAGDMVTLAFGTGLRFGEITALRPCDVDTTRRLLSVAQVVKEEEDPVRHLVIATYGKSDMALRTIRIPDSVTFVIRRRSKTVARDGLLFTAPHGGILHTNGWSRLWAKVVERARAQGLTTNTTLHDFRHAHATHLLAENVSMDTVSRRLGHASVLVTSKIYGHLAPEADQRAADSIDRAMRTRPSRLEETA